jgi:hypothetical protein
MPVNVFVPIKIRVDPDALSTREQDIAEALYTRIALALRHSQRLVLEKRGGYVGVELHAPEFCWSGDGCGDVSLATASWLEQLVRDLIQQQAPRSGVLPGAGREDETVMPLSELQGETLDPERYDPLLDLYLVPSYRGPGQQRVITALSKRAPVAGGQAAGHPSWPAITSQQAFDRAFRRAVRLHGMSLSARGYLGAIFQLAREERLTFSVARFPEGVVVLGGYIIKNLSKVKLNEKTEKFESIPIVLTPQSRYRIRWFSGPGDPKEVQRRFWLPIIKHNLRDYHRKHPKRFARPLSEEELEQLSQKHVEQLLQSDYPQDASFVVISVDSDEALLPLRKDDVLHDLDAILLPLAGVELEGPRRRAAGAGKGKGEKREGGEAGEGEEAAKGMVGVPLYTGEEEKGKEGAAYPAPLSFAALETLVCEPFQDEPALSALGEAGEHLRRMIEEIATLLHIPVCEYAGQFCLNAAGVLGIHALNIGEYAVTEDHKGFVQPLAAGKLGKLGLFEFVPTASPAIQLLRTLASVTPLINRLANAIAYVYKAQREKLPIQAESWILHLLNELAPPLKMSVGYIFVSTCRVLLLQALRASRVEIDKRISNVDNYLPLFEAMVRRHLFRIEDLQRLLNHLEEESRGLGASLAHMAYSTWREAHRAVAAHAVGEPALVSAAFGPTGFVFQNRRGEYVVMDQMRHVWTKAELQEAIASKRAIAEDIDPIVKQLIDMEGFLQRASYNPGVIGVELKNLLAEMDRSNSEITKNVAGDWQYAFRASRIEEVTSSSGPAHVGNYELQGIHQQAHAQIGEFFRGDAFYAEGINLLFGAELGFQSLKGFLIFTGLTVLSIFCPQLGTVVGAGFALHEVGEALEKEELYRALIDPEQVLSAVEVEVELFANELGAMLALIPELGSALRSTGVAARSVSRQGLRGGARLFSRYTRIRITRQIIASLRRGFQLAFVEEMIKAEAIQYVMGKVLDPVMEQLERDITTLGPLGGTTGAEPLLRRLRETEEADVEAGESEEEEEK